MDAGPGPKVAEQLAIESSAGCILLSSEISFREAILITAPIKFTIFSCPRHFWGESGSLQRNAILSWTRLPNLERIILFGNEYGTAEMAAEIGATHIENIVYNHFDTPYVDYIFEEAERLSTTNLLCFVPSDVILIAGISGAIAECARNFNQFLLVANRREIQATQNIDFGTSSWTLRIQQEPHTLDLGRADCLAFTKKLWSYIPPVALGRSAWDHGLVFDALGLGAPVIRIEDAVAFHQAHDYSHTKWNDLKTLLASPEAKQNQDILVDMQGQSYTEISSWRYRQGAIVAVSDQKTIEQCRRAETLRPQATTRRGLALYHESLNEINRGFRLRGLAKIQKLERFMPHFPGLSLHKANILIGVERIDEARHVLETQLADPRYAQQAQEMLKACEQRGLELSERNARSRQALV